jgi:hypothetical protein
MVSMKQEKHEGDFGHAKTEDNQESAPSFLGKMTDNYAKYKLTPEFKRDEFFRKKKILLILLLIPAVIIIGLVLKNHFHLDEFTAYAIPSVVAIASINMLAEVLTKRKFKD